MKLSKHNGKWRVEILDAQGKRRRLGLPVLASAPQREAERAASERIRALLVSSSETERTTAKRLGATFNLAEVLERTYLTRWRGTKSDVQLKYVVRRLEREIGHWLLNEIDYRRLKQYRDDIVTNGASRATANRRMSILKVALREAVREGDLVGMPSFPETLAENNVRERYLTAAEEVRVLDYLDRHVRAEEALTPEYPQWAYMRALAVFLLDTGCRLGEALRLTKTDGRVVHLEHGTTKSMRARVVPLTPRAATAVKAMLANQIHGCVDDDWVGHRWGRVRKACDIEDVNIHILRHTCASRLLERGVDLYTVCKWLGHSSVKVTERYAHLQQGALEQAAAALARQPVAVGTAGTEQFHMRENLPDVGT